MKGTYLLHIIFWCTYILIKYVSLISGSMITYLFFHFNPARAMCNRYAPRVHRKVKSKDELSLVER
jgi:hypothetical protein